MNIFQLTASETTSYGVNKYLILDYVNERKYTSVFSFLLLVDCGFKKLPDYSNVYYTLKSFKVIL